MGFTAEEEKILKLLVTEMKAKASLTKESSKMSGEIVSQVSPIKNEIMSQHSLSIKTLEDELKLARGNLNKELV